MIVKEITSRQNPFVKELYQLSQSNQQYQRSGMVWLEGEHLCRAYLEKVGTPHTIVCSKTSSDNMRYPHLMVQATSLYILDDVIFKHVSTLGSMGEIGYLVTLPQTHKIQSGVNTIILDRLQDPGNVGSILRSGAAFGFQQVIALKGTNALWSGKTLRAGMGAHFSLQLFEQMEMSDLAALNVPLLATSSHTPLKLHTTPLPSPCAWILGHEGQGVSPTLLEQSHLTVCIEQPGGEESLNAAMAASICMYESVRQASELPK